MMRTLIECQITYSQLPGLSTGVDWSLKPAEIACLEIVVQVNVGNFSPTALFINLHRRVTAEITTSDRNPRRLVVYQSLGANVRITY